MSKLITFTNKLEDLPIKINYWVNIMNGLSVFECIEVKPNESVNVKSETNAFLLDCMFTDNENRKKWKQQYNKIYLNGNIGEIDLNRKIKTNSYYPECFNIIQEDEHFIITK